MLPRRWSGGPISPGYATVLYEVKPLPNKRMTALVESHFTYDLAIRHEQGKNHTDAQADDW
eukprot:357713-Chlamydomonas_euryale.AAC.2